MARRRLVDALCRVPALAHAGLDITACGKRALVASPRFDKDGEPVGKHLARLHPGNFSERFAGLREGAVYRYGQAFEFRDGGAIVFH